MKAVRTVFGAVILAAAIMGCSTEGYAPPKDAALPPGSDRCTSEVWYRAIFGWQRCVVPISWNGSAFVLPSKLLYISTPKKAIIIWTLPADATYVNGVELQPGGGDFYDGGYADSEDGWDGGTPTSRFYRVKLRTVDTLFCREYKLKVRFRGAEYDVDPTIANGFSFNPKDRFVCM
jgi:hypothetical protein